METKLTFQLRITGLIFNCNYSRAERCALVLHKASPNVFSKPILEPLNELDWDKFLENLDASSWVQARAMKVEACVFINGSYFGDAEDLIHWAKNQFWYIDCRPTPYYVAKARQKYYDSLVSSSKTLVFMDITVNKELIGKLVIELYVKAVPNTCANFRTLCAGIPGRVTKAGTPMGYKGTQIHRIMQDGWIQGGDIYHGHGDGGEAVDGMCIPDESFEIRHDRRGIVTMANNGRHTANSQFCILMKPCPWMDKKYVAFGRVIQGSDTLYYLEELRTSNQRPNVSVEVSSCGDYDLECVLDPGVRLGGLDISRDGRESVMSEDNMGEFEKFLSKVEEVLIEPEWMTEKFTKQIISYFRKGKHKLGTFIPPISIIKDIVLKVDSSYQESEDKSETVKEQARHTMAESFLPLFEKKSSQHAFITEM